MTMRITMADTRMGESGTLLTSGTTYPVSDTFGASLVGLKYATDTDGVLLASGNVITGSRVITTADLSSGADKVIDVINAATLSIPSDSDLGIPANWRGKIITRQAGAGAVGFTSVNAIGGTNQASAQGVIQELIHVGSNTWQYVSGGSGVTSFSALTDKTTADLPATNTPLAAALAGKQAIVTPTPLAVDKTLAVADDRKIYSVSTAITVTVPIGLVPKPQVIFNCPETGSITFICTSAVNGNTTTKTRERAYNFAGVVLTPNAESDSYGLSGV